MNTDAWPRLVEACCRLIHEASRLLACMTQAVEDVPCPSCLAIAPELIDAAISVERHLALLAELGGHQRTVVRLHAMLIDWQEAVASGSPHQRRYQAAVMQQTIQTLSAALQLQSHARVEMERVAQGLSPNPGGAAKPTGPGETPRL